MRSLLIKTAPPILALLAIAGCGGDSKWTETSVGTAKHYPVAIAGADQAVKTDDTVTLDGTNSFDIDGDTLIYTWTFDSVPTGSGVAFSSASAATPTFAPDLNGTYDITLIINDGEEDGNPDSLSVVSTGTVNKMNLPPGLTKTTLRPTGDFEGKTFSAGTNGEVAALYAERTPYSGETTADGILNSAASSIGSIGTLTRIGITKPPAISDTAVAMYKMTTESEYSPTILLNQVLQKIAPLTSGGSITNLPTAPETSPTSTAFRLFLAVRYESSSLVDIIAAVVTENDYRAFRHTAELFTDGTNIKERSDAIASTSESFSASSPVRDILFVIGNSSGMAEEQTALIDAASDFTTRIASHGIDYVLGVITTDSESLVGDAFTNDTATFNSNVSAATGGSSTGSGVWFAEKGLRPAEPDRIVEEIITETVQQTVTEVIDGVTVETTVDVVIETVIETLITDDGGAITALGYPREGAGVSVVFFTDTGDSYTSFSGGTPFDLESNLFLNLDYKTYSVVNSSSGLYYDLPLATRGSVSPIGNLSVLPDVMEFVADGISGDASRFTLSQTPLSGTISLSVNGTTVANSGTDGWLYNATNNSIVFYGSAAPLPESSVHVSYDRINN